MPNLDTLTITPNVLNLVASIDEFKGSWLSMNALVPEQLQRLRQVATIESVGSSTRIEGSALSDAEVVKLLQGADLASLRDRDAQEVASYAHVMDLVFSGWQQMPLTEATIRQLHRELLRFGDRDDWHRGSYKTSPISITAFDDTGKPVGVVFETASPFDTPRLMSELVEWYGQEEASGNLHPLLRIAVFIVELLEIHPFQDGNGRLSRVLTTLLMLRAGYNWVPYSSLESVIEQSKDRYYLALNTTQRTMRTDWPNWTPWLEFFLHAVQQQAARLRIKLERERIMQTRLPDLAASILHQVDEHGRVTMSDMLALTGASRNTLKLHFRELLGRGLLAMHGSGRGVWYTRP